MKRYIGETRDLKVAETSSEIFIDQNAEPSELLNSFIQKYKNRYSLEPFTEGEGAFLTCKEDQIGILKGKQKLITVDWTEESLLKRFAQTSAKEILIQALWSKKSKPTVLYDMTTGMGTDSFIASKFFQKLILVERNPIMHLLLQDGLRRALAHDKASKFAQKVTLLHADSQVVLSGNIEKNLPKPEVIYFDFMFENKKTQSTKNMEMLRALESQEGLHDESLQQRTLIETAIQTSARVVLKAKRLPLVLTMAPKKVYSGKVVDYFVF